MQLMGSKTKDSSILILDSFLFSKGDKENLSTKKRR